MSSTRSAAVRTGIAGGILFSLHALIPNSRSFPLIWPALTGAVAFWIATRDTIPHRFRRGMLAALIAGAVGGAIGFLAATVTVLAMGRSVFNPIAQTMGPAGPPLAFLSAELAFVLLSIIAVVVALIGGAVMIPVRWARSSHADAPAA
jgi:hypothetical protein